MWRLLLLCGWVGLCLGGIGILMAAGPPAPSHTPNSHAALAAAWLSAMADVHIQQLKDKGAKEAETTFEYVSQKYLWDYRFISFYAVEDEEELVYTKRETWFVLAGNRAGSFQTPLEVPGSQGRLYYLRLSDYALNAGAWEAIVNRSPFFREPEVEHRHAEFLRRALGTAGDKDFSIGFAVYGPWLVRDAAETHKSPTYYDIQFAERRYVPITNVRWEDAKPAGKEEEKPKRTRKASKIIDHPGGDLVYPSGKVVRNVEAGRYRMEYDEEIPEEKKEESKEEFVPPRKGVPRFKFVDFPKTEAELLEATGADVAIKQIEAIVKNGVIFPNQFGSLKNRNEVDRGAIIAHSQSGVSFRNRFVWVFPIISGKFWKTFDVKDGSGKRNIVNQLFNFVYDASEVIWNNPNGSQGYMLFDGKGNRVEFADPEVVKDEPTAYRPYIRTPESCHNCHDQGINVPNNIIAKITLDARSRIDIKSREQDYKDILRKRLDTFFLTTLGRDIKHGQEIYTDFIKRSTNYTTLEQGKQYRMVLKKYRQDVTLEVAARERGMSKAEFLNIARFSPNYDLNAVVKWTPVPRETWDGESYREHVLLEDALKKKKR